MNRLRQWRYWVRPVCIAFCVLMTFVALPLMIVEFQRENTKVTIQLWFVGGLFVLMALPISFWGIIQHLIHYTQPLLQRHIIRVLWMVPIYAINAWFAMKYSAAAIYLDTARECYEAYVIYNFMSYLLVFLRSERENLEYDLEQKCQVKHMPPLCCLRPWKMGSELILRCKHGVMQYTVIRPIMTVIAFICGLFGQYEDGNFSLHSAWLYLMIVNNISQIFAMYCLILFYKATHEELAPIRPISKFLCVKAVVFMSFWQGILISILYAVIPGAEDAELKASQVQDFCICIEMFLAALGHYFSFSHRPFVDPAANYNNWWQSFLAMWDVSDVKRDVAEHLRHVGSTATGVLTGPFQAAAGKAVRVTERSEMTALLTYADVHNSSSDRASDISFDEAEWNILVGQEQQTTNSPKRGNDFVNSVAAAAAAAADVTAADSSAVVVCTAAQASDNSDKPLLDLTDEK